VTSEALYASLTRGATWRPSLIDLKNDSYDFNKTYDVSVFPIWFLPGIFYASGSHRLPDSMLDTTFFNVVHEFYPTTHKAYVFETGYIREKERSYYVPTYGSVQSVVPNQQLITYVFSFDSEKLEYFQQNQVFLLGKKRTMFQIIELSKVIEGVPNVGKCDTAWLQITAEEITHFLQYEILTATMRYFICRGKTKEGTKYIEFFISENKNICLPEFYLIKTPIWSAIYDG